MSFYEFFLLVWPWVRWPIIIMAFGITIWAFYSVISDLLDDIDDNEIGF